MLGVHHRQVGGEARHALLLFGHQRAPKARRSSSICAADSGAGFAVRVSSHSRAVSSSSSSARHRRGRRAVPDVRAEPRPASRRGSARRALAHRAIACADERRRRPDRRGGGRRCSGTWPTFITKYGVIGGSTSSRVHDAGERERDQVRANGCGRRSAPRRRRRRCAGAAPASCSAAVAAGLRGRRRRPAPSARRLEEAEAGVGRRDQEAVVRGRTLMLPARGVHVAARRTGERPTRQISSRSARRSAALMLARRPNALGEEVDAAEVARLQRDVQAVAPRRRRRMAPRHAGVDLRRRCAAAATPSACTHGARGLAAGDDEPAHAALDQRRARSRASSLLDQRAGVARRRAAPAPPAPPPAPRWRRQHRLASARRGSAQASAGVDRVARRAASAADRSRSAGRPARDELRDLRVRRLRAAARDDRAQRRAPAGSARRASPSRRDARSSRAGRSRGPSRRSTSGRSAQRRAEAHAGRRCRSRRRSRCATPSAAQRGDARRGSARGSPARTCRGRPAPTRRLRHCACSTRTRLASVIGVSGWSRMPLSREQHVADEQVALEDRARRCRGRPGSRDREVGSRARPSAPRRPGRCCRAASSRRSSSTLK